jgi:hypothetical protein
MSRRLDNPVGRLTDATCQPRTFRFISAIQIWSRSALESLLGKTIDAFCRVKIELRIAEKRILANLCFYHTGGWPWNDFTRTRRVPT